MGKLSDDAVYSKVTAPTVDARVYVANDPDGTPASGYIEVRDFMLTSQQVSSGGDVTPSDLNPTAGTNFAAVAGRFYWIDIPYCNTLDTTDGNVRVDLPASPSVGDTIGFGVKVQSTATGAFTQAPGFCVEPNPGAVPIDGASYTELNSNGGNENSLWLNGENLILRYQDATIGWAIIANNKKKMQCAISNSGSQTGIVSAATTALVFDTVNRNVGGLFNATTDNLEIKRKGYYSFFCNARLNNATGSGRFRVFIGPTALTGTLANGEVPSGASAHYPAPNAIGETELAANTEVHAGTFHSVTGDQSVNLTKMSLREN